MEDRRGPARVRKTCEETSRCARAVRVDEDAVRRFVDELSETDVRRLRAGSSGFDGGGDHGVAAIREAEGVTEERLAMYTLCVDAMNFCFWPDHSDGETLKLEYEHLTAGWRRALEREEDFGDLLDARPLSEITGEELRALMKWPRPLPNEEERVRLLREVGYGLVEHFDGSCAALIRAANGSACRLVDLVVMYFPGFRDESVYRGRQVFLYKRAQIFVADVWGTWKAVGLGAFHDISQLTMFADYRVPVTLREVGILTYSEELRVKIQNKVEIPSHSEEEIEIRACTVHAVELIKKRFAEQYGQEICSIVVDWLLWEKGEAKRETSIEPHHRTLTIFY
jgi:hypothetical protein